MINQLGLLPGFDVQHVVLSIRAMNPGKVRTEAVLQLQKQAENWIKENAHLGIYIKGNVPSSKNSKDIGKFKKYVDGELKEFTTLRDSAITREYRTVTRPQWANNKRRFLQMTEGLPLPVSVELTFIRDSLRRFDFINAAQIICDLMPECGYITDDETCYIVPVFNPTVYYSKDLAGVVIKVINGNEIKLAF